MMKTNESHILNPRDSAMNDGFILLPRHRRQQILLAIKSESRQRHKEITQIGEQILQLVRSYRAPLGLFETSLFKPSSLINWATKKPVGRLETMTDEQVLQLVNGFMFDFQDVLSSWPISDEKLQIIYHFRKYREKIAYYKCIIDFASKYSIKTSKDASLDDTFINTSDSFIYARLCEVADDIKNESFTSPKE